MSSLVANNTTKKSSDRRNSDDFHTMSGADDDAIADEILLSLRAVCSNTADNEDPDEATSLILRSSNSDIASISISTFLGAGILPDEALLGLVTILAGIPNKKKDQSADFADALKVKLLGTLSRSQNEKLTKQLGFVMGNLYQIGYYPTDAVYEDLVNYVLLVDGKEGENVIAHLRNALDSLLSTATKGQQTKTSSSKSSPFEEKYGELMNQNSNFLAVGGGGAGQGGGKSATTSFQSCDTGAGLSQVPSSGTFGAGPLCSDHSGSNYFIGVGHSSSSFEHSVPAASFQNRSSTSFETVSGSFSIANTAAVTPPLPHRNNNNSNVPNDELQQPRTPPPHQPQQFNNKGNKHQSSNGSSPNNKANKKNSSSPTATASPAKGEKDVSAAGDEGAMGGNPGGDRSPSKTFTQAQLDELKTRTVYLNRLDPSITEGQLRDMLLRCGAFTKVRLCGDVVGRTRYGFVEFTAPDAAKRLMAQDRTTLGSFSMRCLPAKSPVLDHDPKMDAIIDSKKGCIRGCLFGLNFK